MPDTPQAADAAWNLALRARDVEAAAAVLDEDYALLVEHPARARLARDEWLRMLPIYVISDWDVVDSEWDVIGDTAVHSQLVRMEALVGSADRSGLFALSDTWVRRSDGWRVRLRYSTPLSAGDMPRLP
jgi:hypothetical protein